MRSERLITQTPMRIGFLGGGSDLPLFTESGNGPGCVLSATIDRYVTIMAWRRSDEKIIFHNKDRCEHVFQVDALDSAYVREALKHVGWQDGIEISSRSDISAGSGLGGSSAFLVGLLHALHALQGRLVVVEDLAEEAFRLETGPLGKQIGRQDHWAAAFGGFRRYDFEPSGSVRETFLGDLSWMEEQVILLDLGEAHLGDSVFADVYREENRKQNIFLYGVLADIARKGAYFIQKGCWSRFWDLWDDAWRAKKKTSELVSNSDIEGLISAARIAGAQAVKVCGTGGGGYLFCRCPEGRENFMERMSASGLHPTYLSVRFTSRGSQVLFKEDIHAN